MVMRAVVGHAGHLALFISFGGTRIHLSLAIVHGQPPGGLTRGHQLYNVAGLRK